MLSPRHGPVDWLIFWRINLKKISNISQCSKNLFSSSFLFFLFLAPLKNSFIKFNFYNYLNNKKTIFFKLIFQTETGKILKNFSELYIITCFNVHFYLKKKNSLIWTYAYFNQFNHCKSDNSTQYSPLAPFNSLNI